MNKLTKLQAVADLALQAFARAERPPTLLWSPAARTYYLLHHKLCVRIAQCTVCSSGGPRTMTFPHDTCAFPRRVKLCTWEVRLLKALCQRLKRDSWSYEIQTLARLAKALYNQPFAWPQELEEPSKVYADSWRTDCFSCNDRVVDTRCLLFLCSLRSARSVCSFKP